MRELIVGAAVLNNLKSNINCFIFIFSSNPVKIEGIVSKISKSFLSKYSFSYFFSVKYK